MTTTLGMIRIDRVAELDHWPFPTADVFPAVTPALHACATIDLTITTHVVRTPDVVVLVDSGNGNAEERPAMPAHHRFATDYLDRRRHRREHPPAPRSLRWQHAPRR